MEARPEGLPAAASPGTAGDDPGRVDDLLAMYLRDMGGTALLTREGEVALAKRIEAGRRAVLDGLCGSLPAMRTVSAWRDAIHEGSACAAPRNRRRGHLWRRTPAPAQPRAC